MEVGIDPYLLVTMNSTFCEPRGTNRSMYILPMTVKFFKRFLGVAFNVNQDLDSMVGIGIGSRCCHFTWARFVLGSDREKSMQESYEL